MLYFSYAFLSNDKLNVYVQNNLVKLSPILCGFKHLFPVYFSFSTR